MHEKRVKLLRSGAAAQTLQKCKLYDQLVLLRDNVANRPTVSNIASADKSDVDLFTPPDSPPSEVPPTQNESFMEDIHTVTPPTTSRKRKASVELQRHKSEKQEVNPVDQALLKALNDDSAAKVQTLSDPDVAFVHSIIPILLLLPPKKNCLAIVDIQNFLIRYDFGDD